MMKISTVLFLATVLRLGVSKLIWTQDPLFANKWAPFESQGHTTDSDLKCAALCTQEKTCSSFFYMKLTSNCIHMTAALTDPDKLPDSRGAKYYRIYDEDCPVSECWYRLRSGLCLTIYDMNKTYEESKSFCEELGGRLPVLPTLNVSKSGLSMLTENLYSLELASSPFLGAHERREIAKGYEWSDGTTVAMGGDDGFWVGERVELINKGCVKLSFADNRQTSGVRQANCDTPATGVMCERP